MRKYFVLAIALTFIFALSGVHSYNFAIQSINPDPVLGALPEFTKDTNNAMKVTIRASYQWWNENMVFTKDFADKYPALLQKCYLEAYPSDYPAQGNFVFYNLVYKQGEPICNPGRPDHPEVPDYNCIVDINVSYTLNGSTTGGNQNINYNISTPAVGVCGQEPFILKTKSSPVSIIDPAGPNIDLKTFWGTPTPGKNVDINATATSINDITSYNWAFDNTCSELGRTYSSLPSKNASFGLTLHCNNIGSKIIKITVNDNAPSSRTATGTVQIVADDTNFLDVNGFGPYYGSNWEEEYDGTIGRNSEMVKTEVFALNPTNDQKATITNSNWDLNSDCRIVIPLFTFCGGWCGGAYNNFYYRLGNNSGAIEMIECKTGAYDINFSVSNNFGKTKKYQTKIYVPKILFFFLKNSFSGFIGEPFTVTATIKNYNKEIAQLIYAYSKIVQVGSYENPECNRVGYDSITKNQDNNEWNVSADYICNKAGRGNLIINALVDKTTNFGNILSDQPAATVYIYIKYFEVLRMNSFTITPESVPKGGLVNFKANVQNLDSSPHNVKVTLAIYDENNVKKTGPPSQINDIAAGNSVNFIFNDFNTSNLNAKQNYRVVATAYFDDGTGNYLLDAKPVNNTMTRYFYVSQVQATAPEANYWTIIIVLIAVSIVVLKSKQRQ